MKRERIGTHSQL